MHPIASPLPRNCCLIVSFYEITVFFHSCGQSFVKAYSVFTKEHYRHFGHRCDLVVSDGREFVTSKVICQNLSEFERIVRIAKHISFSSVSTELKQAVA